MRLTTLLSTPPSIAVAEEPLDDTAPAAVGPRCASEGFEVVPAWQARSPRRLRRRAAVAPLAVLTAAGALWLGRDHDARALRERPAVAERSGAAPARALVVRAATSDRPDPGSSAR